MSQTNRRQTRAGKKPPSSRNGDMAQITEAIRKAHEAKFGRYTYVDRLDRKKRK